MKVGGVDMLPIVGGAQKIYGGGAKLVSLLRGELPTGAAGNERVLLERSRDVRGQAQPSGSVSGRPSCADRPTCSTTLDRPHGPERRTTRVG